MDHIRSIWAAEGGEGACNYHVRPGAIKIQNQAQYLPNMESARLLELAIAIHIHREPRPVPRLNLYFDGTQVTRSFAAFGSSYAPDHMHTDLEYMHTDLEYMHTATDHNIHACTHTCINFTYISINPWHMRWRDNYSTCSSRSVCLSVVE